MLSLLVTSVRCAGWDLVAPKSGTVKCNFDDIDADIGGKCKITCDPNYSTDTTSVHCLQIVGWHPTKNPVCTPDGSLTMIIVPSVVGSIFLLFIIGFVYARFSNRCQSSTRAHDDDVERGQVGERGRRQGQKYMLKTTKRPGAVEGSEEGKVKQLKRTEKLQIGKEKARSKKKKNLFSKRMQTLYRRPHLKRFARKDKLSLKQKIRDKFHNNTTSTKRFFRKRIKHVKSPWKKRGPKRVIGNPNGVGSSSMCGDIHYISGSQSSFPNSSSCCSAPDSPCCISSCDENQDETADKLASVVPPKKIPPPRPPVPKISSKKSSQQKENEVIARIEAEIVKSSQNVSSGYSSDETQEKRHKPARKFSAQYQKSKSVQNKRRKKKVQVKKKNHHNPYNHYPVDRADLQYQDFEHDYRKKEHIFEGGAYHPQYHPVKTYPMKPALKTKEEKDKNRKPKTKSKPKATDAAQASAKGGVKYFEIKQDKNELKRLKKEKRKLKARSNHANRKDSSRKIKRDSDGKSIQKNNKEVAMSKKSYSEVRESTKYRPKSKRKRKRRDKDDEKQNNSDED